MSVSLWTRILLSAILIGWSVLSYGLVRGAMEDVLPGAGDVLADIVMTMLLMVPMLFLTPLWFLSSLSQHSRARKRRSQGECCECGHPLGVGFDQPCPECGSGQKPKPIEVRRLVLGCLIIWLAAGLIGSSITETIARLDEHSFIHAHEHGVFHPESRSRAWPLWGSLKWDEATRTATGSFLNGRSSFLDFSSGL